MAEVKAIKGGKLIDGTGAEPVEGATVIIEGSKIKAVGKDIEVPRGAKVIDATGKTVMPGMIDSHLHFFGFLTAGFGGLEGVSRPRELGLIKAIQDARNLLAAGFTMGRDTGGMNSVFLKGAVAEGTLSGMPRILSAGYVISQTGGNADLPYFPLECADARTSRHHTVLRGDGVTIMADGVEGCLSATRYALRQGADFIKTFATGEKDPWEFPYEFQLSVDEMKAIVLAAKGMGAIVTCHSQNSTGTKNAILAGVQCIEHATETNDEVIALAKEHGTIFVSTLTVGYVSLKMEPQMTPQRWGYILPLEQMKAARKNREKVWAQGAESYKRIHKAGLILAAGTDCNSTPGGLEQGKDAKELELLVEYCDFTPMEAIVAATKHGSMACFMEDQIGTIESGKFADIIVVDGDPLADIKLLQDVEKIKIVMLGGKVEVDRGL